MNSNTQLKYFIYCRKSSEESSQKQVASIGDQISALGKIIEAEKLSLVREPFVEEKSAKNPGRPVFTDMISQINNGKANALICWDIDRLSRNPIDNGQLQWMLQNGVIKVIKTPGRSFYPEDAGLLMSIEGGRATDYVMRLSKNVKRGLMSKAMRGWKPNCGPIGYINVGREKGDKTIAPDPERFELIRKCWDLFLTGTNSVSKIREIAINEWGLTTVPHRKIGGKPPSLSHFYNIFKDSFYYGYFDWLNKDSGEVVTIKGNHIPMITEQEYKRAQILLGKKGKPQPKTKDFPFTGFMKCGECFSSITAEEKHQIICTGCKYKFSTINKTACPKCNKEISEMVNPVILNYTYYHCTKKKNSKCTQKALRLEELEEQFNSELENLTIDEDYLKLALDYLQEKQKNSGNEEKAIRLSLQSSYDDVQKRLVNLNKEFTSPLNSNYDLFSPEEFSTQKKELIAKRLDLEKKLGGSKEKLDNDLNIAERIFNFCTFAKKHFNSDDIKKKRNIFSSIGSNMILVDKKLKIEKHYPFILIENELNDQKKLYSTLEPKNNPYPVSQKVLSEQAKQSMLPDLGSNQG